MIISATEVRLVLPAYTFISSFVDARLEAVRSQHVVQQSSKTRGSAQIVQGYPVGQFLAVA